MCPNQRVMALSMPESNGAADSPSNHPSATVGRFWFRTKLWYQLSELSAYHYAKSYTWWWGRNFISLNMLVQNFPSPSHWLWVSLNSAIYYKRNNFLIITNSRIFGFIFIFNSLVNWKCMFDFVFVSGAESKDIFQWIFLMKIL